MASRLAGRMSDIGERARERRVETRLDKTDRENDRLKYEVRLLREDLQKERVALQSALDALKRDEHVTVQTKPPKRRGRILRGAVIGGGAYLLGARAGRERYDQIAEKARSLRTSMQDRAGQRGDESAWEATAPATSAEATAPATSAEAPAL